MVRQGPKRRKIDSVVPALVRAATFLGCLLSTQANPAAAQVNTAVPPSRGSLPAAPPWSGVSGGFPRPLTRARVTPPPVRHPAIHPIQVDAQPLRRLFPRAGEVLERKVAREAAMRRHPAGKARAREEVHQPPVTARRESRSVAPVSLNKEDLTSVADCPGTVRVRLGDSLWTIAESLPGHSEEDTRGLSDRIYDMNRPTIGPDPDLILPGQRLVLPEDCER